ncbi:ABC transporter substrate-binding protein [Nocardioides caldifontis]|uniref:ABC transporter substrate-binding protein n=1 Tax=Nocardioides caldifontis TaxID=2588938 RepID=UPI001396B1F7|nr:ABC transporter substrate-binding protein [Nocardioides caldifontis]
MTLVQESRIRTALGALVLVGAGALAGCGSDDAEAGSEMEAGGGATGAPERVRLALDWVPNANHTGFFVADEKGYFEDAGLDLEVMPYSQAPADTVVSAGKAECGVTSPSFLALAVGKGADLKAVMGVVQKPLGALYVLADSEYERPSDLEGKTYGGFGAAGDKELVTSLLQHDGADGNFKYVNLQTGTLEALLSEKVDFVNAYLNVEPFVAEARGVELRAFPYTDAGIPEFPNVVIACNGEWLAENEETAKSFVAAASEGWQFVQDNPADAAQVLVDSNPDSFATDEAKAVPTKGLELMAAEGYIAREGSAPGCLSVSALEAMADRYDEVGYFEAAGQAKPDMAAIATTDYLPEGCEE